MGKLIGKRIGARINGAAFTLRKYIGYGLVSVEWDGGQISDLKSIIPLVDI